MLILEGCYLSIVVLDLEAKKGESRLENQDLKNLKLMTFYGHILDTSKEKNTAIEEICRKFT